MNFESVCSEARQFSQLLGSAVGIGAAQRLRTAGLADGNLCGGVADGTFVGHRERADRLLDSNDFRDDFVGLDDADLRAWSAYAQSFAFADVTQRGALHRRALQFYGLEHGDGRYGAGGTRPLHLF